MARTSRVSREMLTVVTENNMEVVKRIRPPLELTDEQAAEFQRLVNGMAAEWFCTGNMALLCQYCRHVIMARRIAQMIEQAVSELGQDPAAARRMLELEKMQLRESGIIAKLMTQLRLTPQAVAPRNVSMKSMHEVESPWSGLKQITDEP